MGAEATTDGGGYSPSSSSSSSSLTTRLGPEDIARYSQRYDLDGLHHALSEAFRRSERNPNASEVTQRLPPDVVARGGGSTYTTRYKLELDIEQAEYLVSVLDPSSSSSLSLYKEDDKDNDDDDEANKKKKQKEKADFFRTVVLPTYRTVLGNIPPLDRLERTGGLYGFRPLDVEAGIGAVYNKALHVTDFDVPRNEKDGKPLPLLSDSFDADSIQRQWFGEQPEDSSSLSSSSSSLSSSSSSSSHPGIVVIDDILSPAALSRIRQLLHESTVWYQTKMPLRFGGYVGAYIDDGLHDRILLALALELHKSLPRIMSGHDLKYMWAYKYDSDYTGINTHADQAAVNVNLWITPDDANLDPNSGGLVVYTAKPPDDWNFEEYNTHTDRVMEEIIKPTGYANVTVPYRSNRAVLFDSMLFHHTDSFRFRKGYANRRINLTILYGDMQRGGRGGGTDGGGGESDHTARQEL